MVHGLGFIFLAIYITSLSPIIDVYFFTPQLNADDLQLPMSVPPDSISNLLRFLKTCVRHIR